MPANISPVFSLTPNVTGCNIPQTAALARSDGVATVGTNLYVAFAAGVNGSYVQKVRFMSCATTPTTSIATVLRVYVSSVNSGASTANDTMLIGEISVPAIPSANATNATNYYELPLNFALPFGMHILVSQHAAQTANQNWSAVVIGSNY